MKRSSALVEYPSSDEENAPTAVPILVNETQPATKKLKKLPTLPENLLPQIPVDDPTLHQGRRRTTPHVEGQFAAYVYIPLIIRQQSKLLQLIRRIFSEARSVVPSLHPIGFTESDDSAPDQASSSTADNESELHISITRPTYLRAHQREEFKRAVRNIARTTPSFHASFATLSELTNDERTRTFLTLEIGAGHDELKSLCKGLGPTLRAIRQKGFYEDPRFHASIAWALLDHSRDPAAFLSRTGPSEMAPSSTPDNDIHSDERAISVPFPTIPCFPRSLIPQLQTQFNTELVRSGVGTFEVEEVHVQIGKEVTKWKLAG